ncbi:hypothetical protein AAFF_G00332980 [Aldrovandia affinis]|uniref:Uncharacterized protein n=1 Tax=Aldrovandia affinis TaxID=143900 RepID=A0AAD7SLP4_9TELE|nr:hypothetical protein AAFF_G00332980 [Aldrovandia affinis]
MWTKAVFSPLPVKALVFLKALKPAGAPCLCAGLSGGSRFKASGSLALLCSGSSEVHLLYMKHWMAVSTSLRPPSKLPSQPTSHRLLAHLPQTLPQPITE